MDSFRFLFILLTAAVALGCSDRSNDTRITPVSDNSCNVSCAYDHEKYRACLEVPVVTDYTMRQLLPALFPAVGPIVKEQPPGACFCSHATLDDTGKFVSVTITDTTSDNMGDAIRNVILESDAVPIPSGAECVVGIELPLSFNS
jgi:hypothetical protein